MWATPYLSILEPLVKDWMDHPSAEPRLEVCQRAKRDILAFREQYQICGPIPGDLMTVSSHYYLANHLYIFTSMCFFLGNPQLVQY